MSDTTVFAKTAPYEPMLGIPELAEWLAVSEHTVRKWATKGPQSGLVPPMFRVNGVIRFRPQDVRVWLDGKVVGS